jgi:hypothetical protein
MTVEKCQTVLEQIRQSQGTDRPLVRVTTGKSVVLGRITSAAIPSPERRNPESPYALLKLEQIGLARAPISFVQIANIPDDGIAPLDRA